jgi:pimeloyl-ACP methyl ester carboxylesterase
VHDELSIIAPVVGGKVGGPFEERTVRIKGASLRYFLGGEGEPIVLVHGLGGGAANWVELAPELAPRRRVLVPDLPGHGGSEPLPAAPTLAAYADRIVLLMEREGMVPAPIVGHSFGGTVALRAAIRWPDAVTGVVLAAGAGISSGRRLAQALLTAAGLVRPGRIAARWRRYIAGSAVARQLVFGGWGVADPRSFPARAVEGFLAPQELHTDTWSAGRALIHEDPRTALDRVRCPCLVLWGAGDAMVPLSDGFEYARRLRAPLRVIADCGHLLIAERPDACLDAIEAFADALEQRATDRGPKVHEASAGERRAQG